jgi:hypothetical protein
MSTTGVMMDEIVGVVPPQYNRESVLKVEIRPGENTADFDLNSYSTARSKPY